MKLINSLQPEIEQVLDFFRFMLPGGAAYDDLKTNWYAVIVFWFFLYMAVDMAIETIVINAKKEKKRRNREKMEYISLRLRRQKDYADWEAKLQECESILEDSSL